MSEDEPPFVSEDEPPFVSEAESTPGGDAPVTGAPVAGAGGRALVQPPPMQINTGRIVIAGTAIWFVAFVVLLPFYTWLGHHHHRIWLWTCLAGWALGVIGYLIIGRHRRAGRTI